MRKWINEFVTKLGHKEHVEGGFYKETYRSCSVIDKDTVLEDFDGDRNYSTGILFLLTSDIFRLFIALNKMRCGISMKAPL